MFPSERNFFQLLAYGKDKKQKKKIIKFINKSQFNIIKNISKKILNGDIHLRKVQISILRKKKTFLRNLSEGKIKIKDLPRYCTIVCNIIRIGLKHYEKHSKISSRTHRKMGKNRGQNPCKRSSSEVSSSDECISSEESYISGEESEESEIEKSTSYVSGEESEKSTRIGEISTHETNSNVSFSNSGEEEESI